MAETMTFFFCVIYIIQNGKIYILYDLCILTYVSIIYIIRKYILYRHIFNVYIKIYVVYITHKRLKKSQYLPSIQ